VTNLHAISDISHKVIQPNTIKQSSLQINNLRSVTDTIIINRATRRKVKGPNVEINVNFHQSQIENKK